jgi:hypothetical protein
MQATCGSSGLFCHSHFAACATPTVLPVHCELRHQSCQALLSERRAPDCSGVTLPARSCWVLQLRHVPHQQDGDLRVYTKSFMQRRIVHLHNPTLVLLPKTHGEHMLLWACFLSAEQAAPVEASWQSHHGTGPIIARSRIVEQRG